MGKSTNDTDGRSGNERVEEKQQKILENARRILADASEFLEDRVDSLKELKAGSEDMGEVKELKRLIIEMNSAWRTLLEVQSRTDATMPNSAILDLEAARAEIERRLTRLAAREQAEGISR